MGNTHFGVEQDNRIMEDDKNMYCKYLIPIMAKHISESRDLILSYDYQITHQQPNRMIFSHK